MNLKRLTIITFIILLSITTFIFSNSTGKNSNNTSNIVTEKMLDVYSFITKKEIPQDQRRELILDMRLYIRKTAHFTLYFILGILIYIFIDTYNIKHKILISIILSCLFACTDEIHQLFVDGRTGSILDVLLDTIGSTVGILILNSKRILTKALKK